MTCGRWAESWLKVKDKAVVPVEIGKIQSSLWMETGWQGDEGAGQAFLILSDGDLECDELLDQLNGIYSLLYSYEEDIFYQDSNGLMAVFAWSHYDDEDAGYEGIYTTSGYAYSEEGDLERQMLSLLFGEGVMWFTYYGTPGVAEITEHSDKEVSGTIRTTLFDASFTAENCGASSYYDDDDGYYYYESGWLDAER